MKYQNYMALVLFLCFLSSCGEQDTYVVKGWKHIGRTDTLGLESIAERIDTLTFDTDSLYDISIFGVSENRLFGMTADNIIVILDHNGRVIGTSRRSGRGPGEFVNLGCCVYDPYHNEILILDLWNKIIILDDECRLKDEIKNSTISSVGDILPLGQACYAATGMSYRDRDYGITVLDRSFNPVNRLFPLMNDAQRSTERIVAIEYMMLFNSKVLYKPFGEYTYYAVSDTSYVPYLRVDFGRYAESDDMHTTVGDNAWKEMHFQVEEEFICGRYYFVKYLYQKDSCWFYDIYDIITGERVSHYRYGIEEYEKGVDEGFILRFDGKKYGIIPQYVKDNILYWSCFSEDGITTLFRIYL